jgi:hypothetical protein
MVNRSRLRSSVVLLGVLIPLGGAAQPSNLAAAQADVRPSECAVTGYLVDSKDELVALRRGLVEQPVQRLDGVPLASGQTWVLPEGSQPVVVMDLAEPVSGGTVSVAMAGQEFEVDSSSYDEPRHRYVTGVYLPHLGPTTRSLGLRVETALCGVALDLSVDRSLWSTVVGAVAVAVTVLFGLLTVWVARLRKGGWLRRFGFAAPLGLLAGIGQAVVLMEAGWVGPFQLPPWWAPAAGLALAALLPLTRRRSRGAARSRAAAPVSAEPPTVWQPPVHAPLGGYRVEVPFTTTEVAAVYRAVDDAGDRALLKLLPPERYGQPAARLRLEREARALSGWDHPNVLRLRETVSEQAGAPTLVFEDVAGAPLRQLLDGGGTLTGPQAANVVLGALSGLRAVHERELVHRDVRPENVWLDTGGRVLLAGFELAATGVEHPMAPEGAAPYASPEQRAAAVLDARSDLWACGMLLAELLTGQPALPPAGTLPEPLAAVLARALAENPDGRPATARRLSAELWDAAEQVYGTDWVGRGALAGALVAQGTVGAAAAGYALGGVAGTGVATGTGAGVAAAGVGEATGAAGGGGGPVGAVVNAAVAVVAGIAVAAGVVVINPDPAEARSVVITPDQARVIFLRTIDQGRAGDDTHFTTGAEANLRDLLAEHDSLAEAALTGVAVGVPPDQYEFPAWFVASATIPYEDGTASIFARFDRESAGEPWLLTTLVWSTDQLLPPALVDVDGWLAPAPDPVALAIAPDELPDIYRDWFIDQWTAFYVDDDVDRGAVIEHDQLSWLPHQDSYLVELTTVDVNTAEGLVRPATVRWPANSSDSVVARQWLILDELTQTDLDARPDEESSGDGEEVELPPTVYEDLTLTSLAGDAALVSFVVTGAHRVRGTDEDGNTGPCGAFPSFAFRGSDYRVFVIEYEILVQAWIPLVGAGEQADEPIPLTDPIIATTIPSDYSEPC